MLLSLTFMAFFFPSVCHEHTVQSRSEGFSTVKTTQTRYFNRDTQSVPAAANWLLANVMDSIELHLE